MLDDLAKFINRSVNWARQRDFSRRLRLYPGISPDASLGSYCELIGPAKHFKIGAYTYLNRAHLSCGQYSTVTIGTGCAVGYNVSINAITHSKEKPTNDINGEIVHLEQDIIIGDGCWIGSNVYIRKGVVLGNNVIVGANSVVTHSFGHNVVIAGAPARILHV